MFYKILSAEELLQKSLSPHDVDAGITRTLFVGQIYLVSFFLNEEHRMNPDNRSRYPKPGNAPPANWPSLAKDNWTAFSTKPYAQSAISDLTLLENYQALSKWHESAIVNVLYALKEIRTCPNVKLLCEKTPLTNSMYTPYNKSFVEMIEDGIVQQHVAAALHENSAKELVSRLLYRYPNDGNSRPFETVLRWPLKAQRNVAALLLQGDSPEIRNAFFTFFPENVRAINRLNDSAKCDITWGCLKPDDKNVMAALLYPENGFLSRMSGMDHHVQNNITRLLFKRESHPTKVSPAVWDAFLRNETWDILFKNNPDKWQIGSQKNITYSLDNNATDPVVMEKFLRIDNLRELNAWPRIPGNNTSLQSFIAYALKNPEAKEALSTLCSADIRKHLNSLDPSAKHNFAYAIAQDGNKFPKEGLRLFLNSDTLEAVNALKGKHAQQNMAWMLELPQEQKHLWPMLFDSRTVKAIGALSSNAQTQATYALGNHEETIQQKKETLLGLFSHQSQTHYDILGIASTANADAIRKGYHVQSLKYHPDKLRENATEETNKKFLEAKQAYDILNDPQKRIEYDQQLNQQIPPWVSELKNEIHRHPAERNSEGRTRENPAANMSNSNPEAREKLTPYQILQVNKNTNVHEVWNQYFKFALQYCDDNNKNEIENFRKEFDKSSSSLHKKSALISEVLERSLNSKMQDINEALMELEPRLLTQAFDDLDTERTQVPTVDLKAMETDLSMETSTAEHRGMRGSGRNPTPQATQEVGASRPLPISLAKNSDDPNFYSLLKINYSAHKSEIQKSFLEKVSECFPRESHLKSYLKTFKGAKQEDSQQSQYDLARSFCEKNYPDQKKITQLLKASQTLLDPEERLRYNALNPPPQQASTIKRFFSKGPR